MEAGGQQLNLKQKGNDIDRKRGAVIAREGKNSPIQSLNADIIKLAMGQLYHRLRPFNASLINVVHDELVFEVPKSTVKVMGIE